MTSHRRPRSGVVRIAAAITAAVLLSGVAVPLSASAAPGDAGVNVTKGNDLGGQPLVAGESVTYNLYLACTSIEVDCLDYTFVDTLPEGLVLDTASLPASTPLRDVTYDPATRELRIAYRQPTDNPVGSGWQAGSNQTFDIRMSLPADTPVPDASILSNTAVVDAANADPLSVTNDVTVDVPPVVAPIASKTWAGGDAVARSGQQSTVQLGVRNGSSGPAAVTALAVTDQDPDTFDSFDLTGVSIGSFPPGADRARLLVCTNAASDCSDADFVAAGATSLVGPVAIAGGIDVAAVTGVRVVFENSTGAVIPISPTAGSVDLGLMLRDTERQSGDPLAPAARQPVENCATPTATSGIAESSGADACATKAILPDTLALTPSKQFFADTDGDFSSESGEYAVVGQSSPVSARVRVSNDSAFPVSEIVVSEPSADSPSEFDKFDASALRVTLPAGAASAAIVVTYADATSRTIDLTASGTADVSSTSRVTGVQITYSGAGGAATIQPGSTAELALHGTLNEGVDDSDLASGGSPTVTDCAGVTGSAGRTDGTGTFTGSACGALTPQAPRASASGVKTVGRTVVPEGEPVPFSLRYTNNGNLPLASPVMTDPPADADGRPITSGNPFTSLRITGASVSKSSGSPAAVIEVFDPQSDAWAAYGSATPSVLERATGVRVTLAGDLAPTGFFQLDLTTERRPGVADGTVIANCFSRAAVGYAPVDASCAPAIATAAASAGASVNKTISPATLPEYVPGLPPQTAAVTLTARNTGNLSASLLGITDADAVFFDAVDFTGFGPLVFPQPRTRDSRVQIDAVLADGTTRDGNPSATAALPGGVAAADVVGLTISFSSESTTNDGYLLTPCADASCEGSIVLQVSPRPTLRSDPSAAIPDALSNSATGFVSTRLQRQGEVIETPPVVSGLALVDGTPVLDVEKSPNSSIAPGEVVPFDLVVTNSGTANLPEVVVVDNWPTGLLFDETFVGDGGSPFVLTYSGIPAGSLVPPAPTLSFERTEARIDQIAFDFGDWVMPPGATITIRVQATLEPGVLAGDVIANTMGATSSAPGLQCAPGDGTSSTGEFGAGQFCTDGATVTTRSGAAFDARKWVAGNPALGWYNSRLGRQVATGDPSCPSITVRGISYTATPCIALVNPGDAFDYVLRVTNAGTEPGTRMTIVDRFPSAGDTGTLGAPRGTQWDSPPTLLGAPVLSGPGTVALGYSESQDLCLDDLALATAGCADDQWSSELSAATVAFQAELDFTATPLAPGAGVDIEFSMRSPNDVTRVSDPTVAWNSFAHAETTLQANGQTRILPPIEPIKTGVALSYGSLAITKSVGDNPAALDLAGVPFEFHYRCAITPIGAGPTVVADARIVVEAGQTVQVDGIPAGAECRVWETSSLGGVSSAATEAEASVVTIVPVFGTAAADPGTVAAAEVENDFPLGVLRIDKNVVGPGAARVTGDFGVEVTCSYNGQTVAGYPLSVRVPARGSSDVAAPVGSTCSVRETDAGGAESTTIAPDEPVVMPNTTTGGVYLARVTITNRFETTAAGEPGLPVTGASLVVPLSLTGLMLALIGAGLVLSPGAGRRRRSSRG